VRILVNPPIREQASPYIFPLGLGYIASVLTEAGRNKLLETVKPSISLENGVTVEV